MCHFSGVVFQRSKITFIPDKTELIAPQLFDSVFTALKTNRTLQFDYRPLQKTTFLVRTVDPYHTARQKGNWYVLGFCHTKREVRIFAPGGA